MYEDTKSHVLNSDHIQLGYVDGELKGFALYSMCLGGAAVELVGIVVDPQYQGSGFGSSFLADYIERRAPDFVTAYTRNPSTVGLLNHYNGTFPINTDRQLEHIASEMDNAELIEGVAYHIGRYGQDGLYGVNDPADRHLRGDDVPMKVRYQRLSDPGNALVLASRTGGIS